MMLKKNSLVLLSLFMLHSLCSFSESYREKYADVIEHYQKKVADTLKVKAALYLIDNMDGHKSPEGKALDKYVIRIRQMRPRSNMGELTRAWDECTLDEEPIMMTPDSSVVTCRYLIDNIDSAFEAWENAPWKDDISFQQFCEFILPYRVKDEHLCTDWRRKLRHNYKDILKGVSNMNEAFVLLRQEVLSRIKNFNTFTPYLLDVMSYDHIQRANCNQRCIVLASVMRSFAIPVAMDEIPYWADYSSSGHSWISLVLRNGDTYTVYENESVAKQYNKIDASNFVLDFENTKLFDCPYQIKTSKSVSKIYRVAYGMQKERKGCIYRDSYDVSDRYNLEGEIDVPMQKDTEVYLCTYLTGRNWQAVDKVQTKDGYAQFRNLGKNIIYLPMVRGVMGLKAVSDPILLDANGKVKILSCDRRNARTITIDRKYPLCSYMPVQWEKLIDGVFEASNDSLFNEKVTLAKIKKIPYGDTKVVIDNSKRFRYIRFRCSDNDIGLLSELAFYDDKGKIVKGANISKDVDVNSIVYLHDDDVETKIKALSPGYWVGVDLGEGKECRISEIKFTPVSDGNNIQNGHTYELWGFDKYWKKLGHCIAQSRESILFHNVPTNILLLLKDKTKGIEERIFLYNNKQLWY